MPSSAACWVLRENQHYPPSWVEATTSLDQVVFGSATPVGASQWSFCRTGGRASRPAPGDIPDPSRQAKGEGGPPGCNGSRRRQGVGSRCTPVLFSPRPALITVR